MKRILDGKAEEDIHFCRSDPMMKTPLKYRIAGNIVSKVPFKIVQRLCGVKPIIFYYHMVNNEEVAHVKYLYRHKNIKQFERDLDFLLKRYCPVNLGDVLEYLIEGNPLPDNSFLLTFDDGFREMYDIVAPVLLSKGICATFFVCSGFIDNMELCCLHKASVLAARCDEVSANSIRRIMEGVNYDGVDCKNHILRMGWEGSGAIDRLAEKLGVDFAEYLREHRPYLNSDEIRGLIRRGFHIGGHSIDHPIYSSLSLNHQVKQTIESVGYIREKFSLNYGAFAFPYTDHGITAAFFAELNKSGIVDVSFGNGGLVKDCVVNNLQRISLEKPLIPAEKIIASECTRKLYRMIKRSNTRERF